VRRHSGVFNVWCLPYRAEGFHAHGSEYSEKILNILQRSAEKCDHLHGFLCLFSLGGGTGSGLGSAMLTILEDNFPLIERYDQLKNSCILY
jgi:tubulin epsilon